MSLHKFAEQVAANGRGDDSLLVHMTPDEVRNLQKFAEANGTTLTINPTTGLPEAGLLSDLFKAVAPIALGAFLGPGAFGIAGLGLSAGTAGLVTGGLTTLATGSLSRGLMAGLGAYGGAGLAESFMGAGVGAAQQSAMGSLSADQIASEMANTELTKQGVLNQAAADATKSAMANTGQAVSSGFNVATATPSAMGAFAKQNLGNIAAAAAPIMAGAMVPTTTKLPDPKDTGRIRQMAFNINPDTGRPDPLYGMREMTPVKTSEFANKTFKGQRDLFYQQNPNPYELGVGSLNQPPQQQATPMAGGGIVALAGGGDYTTLTKDSSAEDIASAYKQFTTASGGDTAANQKAAVDYLTNLGIGQDKIGQAYGTYQASPTYTAYTPEQMGSFLSNPVNKDINLDKAIIDTNANPADVNRYIASLTSPFVGSTDTTGGSGTLGIYNQFNAQGISPDEYYAAAIASNPKYAGWSKADITRGYNLDKGALALSAAEKDGVSDKEWVNFMDTNGYSVNDMAQAFGLSKNEVQRRYDAAKKVDKIVTTGTGGTGTGGTGGTGTGSGITTVMPQPFTSVIPGGFYGNATNPGDITTNKDGTVTVHPNIPYRPYGGFSGMEEVRNAYTKGGGSLGYKAAVPKTPAEHNALYNKQTDDSLDAYNFLMGKGKNLTQRTATADRPVMRRYDEAILGRKIPRLTKPGTTTTKTDTKETVAGDTAVVGGVNFDLTDPTKAPAEDNNGPWSWDVVNKRWVQYGKFADGGMTGYAMGGGLGSLGSYSDGGRLLKGPGDGVSDSIPATIGQKQQPARLADGEFVIPARIVSELGNGSTDAGAKKLYAMMDRVQRARGKTTGKNKVAANSRADKYLPA
jgi:hypothetical protein